MQILSRSIRQLTTSGRPQALRTPSNASFRGSAGARSNFSPIRPGRSHVTRVLHFLLLATVLHQLVGSRFMEKPLPGEDADWPFVLHSWIGMAGFSILALFWLWTLVRSRSETPVARLVPWFSASGRRAVVVDMRRTLGEWVAWKAPDPGDGALASAVHGLGLLVASAMALSGASYFLFLEGTSMGKLAIQAHKFLANFMWAYLIGHASLAALHALLGDDVFSRMFWLKKRGTSVVKAP